MEAHKQVQEQVQAQVQVQEQGKAQEQVQVQVAYVLGMFGYCLRSHIEKDLIKKGHMEEGGVARYSQG